MPKLKMMIAAAGIAGLTLAGSAAHANDRRDERDDRDDRGDSEGRPTCTDTTPDKGRLEVVGLTADQRLICFAANKPAKASTLGSVTGLAGDTALVGIDHRPATGELFGLGNAGGVYSIATAGAATKRSQLSTALTGSAFGVDFNPTVDRLRIVSDDGQNLRVNVDTGATTVDTPVNYSTGVRASGVSGAAYTNNDSDPNTATTLFDIDAALDQVVIQAPPNAGSLSATGKLRVNTTTAVGSDIYSTVRNGTTVKVEGFASLTVEGASRFYRVNLLTGEAILTGQFATADQVVGIAIPLNQLR